MHFVFASGDSFDRGCERPVVGGVGVVVFIGYAAVFVSPSGSVVVEVEHAPVCEHVVVVERGYVVRQCERSCHCGGADAGCRGGVTLRGGHVEYDRLNTFRLIDAFCLGAGDVFGHDYACRHAGHGVGYGCGIHESAVGSGGDGVPGYCEPVLVLHKVNLDIGGAFRNVGTYPH